MAKKKVVAIYYLDHALYTRDEGVKEPVYAVTVGVLADEHEKYYCLDLNMFDTGRSDTMVIVKGAVENVVELGEIECAWNGGEDSDEESSGDDYLSDD